MTDNERFPVMKDTKLSSLAYNNPSPFLLSVLSYLPSECIPFSFFLLADHCVHYYDLRNTKQPIMVFKGHRKAVSYAKFVNGEEIVSA